MSGLSSLGIGILALTLFGSIAVWADESDEPACAFVEVANIVANPAAFADRPSCLHGTLRYHNGAMYLGPGELGDGDVVRQGILVMPTSNDVLYGDLRSLDRVEAEGMMVVSESCFRLPAAATYDPASVLAECNSGPLLSLFVNLMRVTSREVSTARCQIVPIADLYAAPLSYNETVVCTEGYLAAERTGSVHDLAALVPANYPEDQLAVASIDIDLTAWQLPDRDLRDGDRIAVRGRFLMEPTCFLEDGEEVADTSSEVVCWPVEQPMWIANPEVELVQ